jgi:3-oxoacyl-ACP reductase-like protein
MGTLTLHELIDLYRDEIIRRCEIRSAPEATGHWMNQGVAAFLDQLMVELRDGPSRTEAINEGVMPGGDELMSPMPTVSQVTQPYRGVGRSVVDLALELNVPMSEDDVVMLDRCLDAAIAHAVAQHVSRQTIASDGAVNTLQHLTDTAISAFEVLRTGSVGVMGRTGTLVLRSLMDIRVLTEQST